MQSEVGSVRRTRRPPVKLRIREFEAKLIWPGLEIYQRFKVRAAGGPIDRGEAVVEAVDGEGAVDGLFRRVAYRSVNENHLLIDLSS